MIPLGNIYGLQQCEKIHVNNNELFKNKSKVPISRGRF